MKRILETVSLCVLMATGRMSAVIKLSVLTRLDRRSPSTIRPRGVFCLIPSNPGKSYNQDNRK